MIDSGQAARTPSINQQGPLMPCLLALDLPRATPRILPHREMAGHRAARRTGGSSCHWSQLAPLRSSSPPRLSARSPQHSTRTWRRQRPRQTLR
eukprot:scaffold4393_cov252-Prasinococcus_capsulatus_cf.AAC.4